MAEMQQSREVLAEAETSLRQQVSSLQVSRPPCKQTETLVCLWQIESLLMTHLAPPEVRSRPSRLSHKLSEAAVYAWCRWPSCICTSGIRSSIRGALSSGALQAGQ